MIEPSANCVAHRLDHLLVNPAVRKKRDLSRQEQIHTGIQPIDRVDCIRLRCRGDVWLCKSHHYSLINVLWAPNIGS